MPKILTIVGARPQFIKAAVVSQALRSHTTINELLLHTGQHFDANMSDNFFAELSISEPDYFLNIGGGTHGENTGRMLEAIEKVCIEASPDIVLVYGDTDSTLAGALAAAKLKLPVAHVEAGLRSYNRDMPEEINRVMTDHLSLALFAPTEVAVANLKREGICGDRVSLTGDVMLDLARMYDGKEAIRSDLEFLEREDFALVTFHRAENTNDEEKLNWILSLIEELSEHMLVVLPLHPRLRKILGSDHNQFNDKVVVTEPLAYLEIKWLLQHCHSVFTDSGGLQKEAYFHSKLCTTIRTETEWVELVSSGWNSLAAPGMGDVSKVVQKAFGRSAPVVTDLYGNGDASKKIAERLMRL